MMEAKENLRYEIKFVSEISRYGYFKSWIISHPLAFFEAYPTRKVNNIYFDDFDINSFVDNIDGTSLRKKMRLRWYGDTTNPKTAVLEIKCKKNKLGWKSVNKIDLTDFELGKENYKTIISFIKKQLSNEHRIALSFKDRPILLNRYDREYYESRDRKVRFTIDRNIEFHNQRFAKKIRLRGNQEHSYVIIEMKVQLNDVAIGMKALERIPLSPSKFSKFVTGVCTSK
ncbi:VTC domain-containing protein [Thermodesulfobacteriota bacterium]